jgi:hypothetical protein
MQWHFFFISVYWRMWEWYIWNRWVWGSWKAFDFSYTSPLDHGNGLTFDQNTLWCCCKIPHSVRVHSRNKESLYTAQQKGISCVLLYTVHCIVQNSVRGPWRKHAFCALHKKQWFHVLCSLRLTTKYKAQLMNHEEITFFCALHKNHWFCLTSNECNWSPKTSNVSMPSKNAKPY